jgi:ectoine hydroxylase-related dioxygenase (phytanoyl-CoA dioxygenase family)
MKSPLIVFLLQLLLLSVAQSLLAQTAEEYSTATASTDDARFDQARRETVSSLVKAALQAANATTLEELFTNEELESLLAITKGDQESLLESSSSAAASSSSTRDPTPVCAIPELPTTETHHNSRQQQSSQSPITIDSPFLSSSSNESLDDRRARLIAEAPLDYDCMEREFDASDPNFDPHEAAKVYFKCRLLVVRNVYTPKQMERFKKVTEDFVLGLHQGIVSKNAKITNEQEKLSGYFNERTSGKWEILHPDYFLKYAKDFVVQPTLLNVLMDPFILGDDAIFGGSGALLAEPFTDAGHWHTDDTFLFGRHSHNTIGLAGHDIPSFAINMATPLANVTADSGITEYCMGSSHLAGVAHLNPSPELAENPFYADLYEDYFQGDACPPTNWRAPNVNPGDVIFWDYLIRHRSGANRTPKNRPLMFSTYGRRWYHDDNFTPQGMGYEATEEDIFLAPRFMAVLDDPYVRHCGGYLCDLFAASPKTETEDMTDIGILFKEGLRRGEPSPSNAQVYFVLANKDIENAVFSLPGHGEFAMAPGEYSDVESNIGSELVLKVDGLEIQSWTIRPKQRQIMVSQQSVGLAP